MNERSVRFMTHSPPTPGISGDRVRVFHLIRELKRRGWSVRVWSLVAPDEPHGSIDAVAALADEVVLVPRGLTPLRRFGRLARDVIAGRAFQAHWFWSPASARAAEAWLDDLGQEPLLVEQLYMYAFVPPRLRDRVVLDTHNHEGARIRAIARGEGGIGRRVVARLQVGPVDRYEREALRSVSRVLAVSTEEAAEFERVVSGRVRVVPNGVDVSAIHQLSMPTPSRDLLFLGSLGYSANRDAIRHFAADIAPLLVDERVGVTIVGSNPGKLVRDLAARAPVPMRVTGFVPDLAPSFGRSRAMIVPLRHGAGTRLKILEALAWGLPVVTTTIGGAGLGLVDGVHALIADSPAAFAAAVRRLLDDDALWSALSRAGRALVEERYTWDRVGDQLEAGLGGMDLHGGPDT